MEYLIVILLFCIVVGIVREILAFMFKIDVIIDLLEKIDKKLEK